MPVVTSPADDPVVVRLRVDLAYDGSSFHGWATQPGQRTVQDTIESALELVLRLPEVRLTVAGRTDAGVHARGQVCHTDVDGLALERVGGPTRLRDRLSRLLPSDIVVREVQPAAAGFDARFSALSREYVYRIDDRRNDHDPLSRNHVLWWPRALDEAAMHAAGRRLLGEHDFAAFCRRRQGATTVRGLLRLDCVRDGGLVHCVVAADAFCHSMVRSVVGALLVVGEGRRPITWPAELLAAKRRDPAAPVVAAHGLTLELVSYPPDAELATRAALARTVRDLGVVDE